MKNKQMIVALLAGGLALATDVQGGGPPETAPAQPTARLTRRAICGCRTVRRRDVLSWLLTHSYVTPPPSSDDRSGTKWAKASARSRQLIVNLDLNTVRVAIIKCGGTLESAQPARRFPSGAVWNHMTGEESCRPRGGHGERERERERENNANSQSSKTL